MLEKQQLIAAIQRFNPSVQLDWLDSFDHAELCSYLNRLELTRTPRGGQSAWVRTGHSRAVVTRRPAA
jgi:hypothetical protein